MFARLMIAGLTTILLASALPAQDMTNAQLTSEVRSIRAQLNQVSGNVTKALEVVNENAAKLAKVDGAVNENNTQINNLKQEMLKLTNDVKADIEKQIQILDAISQQDSSGRYIPRLSAAMESETFRRDLDTAVHQAIRREGVFEVTNTTGSHQWIQVNKLEYGVNPGETVRVTVPVGTVTTRLPGKEKETWTVSAPNYRMGINIIVEPTPPTVVTGRPIYGSPMWYQTPVYSSPSPYNAGIPVVYR